MVFKKRSAVFFGIAFGLLFFSLLNYFSGGPCTPSVFFPVNMVDPEPFFGLGGDPCEIWPPSIIAHIFYWLPIGVILVFAASLSQKLCKTKDVRVGISTSLSIVLLVLAQKIVPYMTNHDDLQINLIWSLVFVFVAVLLAILMGYIGACLGGKNS